MQASEHLSVVVGLQVHDGVCRLRQRRLHFLRVVQRHHPLPALISIFIIILYHHHLTSSSHHVIVLSFSQSLFSSPLLSYRFNKPSCHLIIQTSYTIINIMQPSRNNRRKRKDAESRDFTCKCGKSYLSYAAAYTHVKNKHQLEKTYLIDITKPQR